MPPAGPALSVLPEPLSLVEPLELPEPLVLLKALALPEQCVDALLVTRG